MSLMLLGDVVSLSKIERRGNRDVPYLSMSSESGLSVDNSTKVHARSTLESSKIVRYGQLVTGLHMDEGSIWVQKAVNEGAVSGAYEVLDIDTEKIDTDYLNYALHTTQSLQYFKETGVGSTSRRCKVPWTALKNMPVVIPSLDEQRKIVRLMNETSILAQTIRSAINIIDIAESSIFREFTVKADCKILEEIADLTFGKSYGGESVSTKGEMAFCSGASDFGEVYISTKKRTSKSDRAVEPDSVLISVRDPVGKTNITPEKCALGRGLVGATPKSGISDSHYLYLALSSKAAELESIAYGIIKCIGPKEIKRIALDYIDIQKQRELAKVFLKLEKIRSNLRGMLDASHKLEQKILQEKFGYEVEA